MKFFVPGLPVAQPRQRNRVINVGGRVMAANYTPTNSPANAFKATVRMAYEHAYEQDQALRYWELDSAVAITVRMIFPRPASMTKKKKANLQCPKKSKPDIENVAKAVFDALTGVAYIDDAQISKAMLVKRIAGDGDSVGVWIEIDRDYS